jgi:hypothetical protein
MINASCSARCIDVMKVLLKDPRVNPSARNNTAIITASRWELLDMMELLMSDPRVNPAARANKALRGSMKANYQRSYEVAKMLQRDSRVDPSVEDNAMVRWAADRGDFEMVRMLLKDARVNPSAQDQFALRKAIYKDQSEVVKVLLVDARVVLTPLALRLTDTLTSAKSFQAIVAARPRFWADMIDVPVPCRPRDQGVVRKELDRMEKESWLLLLLNVKRRFTARIAARVADVLREVCAEWTRYWTVESDTRGLGYVNNPVLKLVEDDSEEDDSEEEDEGYFCVGCGG